MPFRENGEIVVEGETASWMVVQDLIVAFRASRQSTGCLLTPSSSATRTTLVENRFIAVANELNPAFAAIRGGAVRQHPQQPVIKVTSGRSL